MQQQIIQETRLDKVLAYLTSAPVEVQVIWAIGFFTIAVLFLKSDWSNFITNKLTKKK